MTSKSFLKGMILLVIPLLLLSCHDERETLSVDKSRIICSVDKFDPAESSRTNTDPNNGFLITWASGDSIGIFPYEGYQEPFAIPANQVDSTYASFDGGYWSMKEGLKYNAYYPFDKVNFESAEMKTKIPVTYIGQKQNGMSCDIGAFDYTYSDWKMPSNGAVNFDFHHIGSIAVFTLKYPATTSYKELTVSVDDVLIPLTGHYDLTADDVAFVANKESKANSISLSLNNCSGEAGETGTFYMMLPPMDLSNNEVTLTLTSTEGTSCSYSIEKALNIKKGKLYRRTGIPKSSDVGGTVDGWIEDEEVENTDNIPYLTFTADAEQTLTMSKAVETLEYSVGGGAWATLGTTTVTFGGSNGDLKLRGKSSYGTARYSSDYSQISFGNDVPVACNGDIRTLIDYENYATANTGNARFCCLFSECSNLTKAPALPATTLADYCYYFMFWGCNSLKEPPELPATTLTESCYAYMFRDCENLISAPALPATNLAERCYESMLSECSKLTVAPVLPATTLKEYCYSYMFYDCTKLNKVTMLATRINGYNCLASWLDNVSSTGTFTKAKEMESLPAGVSGIPSGWTVENYGEDEQDGLFCWFNPNQYITYVGNYETVYSGDNMYNFCSNIDNPIDKISKIEFKYEMEESSKAIYLCCTNCAKDDYSSLILNQTGLMFNKDDYDSDDNDKYEDYSYTWSELNVTKTDCMTLITSFKDEYIKLNGVELDYKMHGYTSFEAYQLFSYYFTEYDEGRYTVYEGVPEGSKLYYVKIWDENDKLVYIGGASKALNPKTNEEEYCWRSYYNGEDHYEFAYHPQNQTYQPYGGGVD